HDRQARDVPTRARKAGDESASYGIENGRHDDRDRRGRLLDGLGRRPTHRHDDGRLHPDQIGREGRVSIIISLRPSWLDLDVLAVHITELAQTQTEGFESPQPYRVGRRARRQIAYPGNPITLLSLRCERGGEDISHEYADEPSPVDDH